MTASPSSPAMPANTNDTIEMSDLTYAQAPSAQSERMRINFGPSHPATHGTLRVMLELDGETIVGVEPEIGYLHTGFEKIAEELSYSQFIPLSDRMNYLSAINNNIGYAIAVEELLGMELPERAQYARVILAELGRIADHLVWLGMQAVDIGAFTAFLWGFTERERLYDIFEAVCGARLTTSITRIGGMIADLPHDFDERVKGFLKGFDSTMADLDRLLTRNRIWIDRTQGISPISQEDAISFGLSGPVLRATGVEYDVRKANPYLVYDRMDFEVVIGDNGDVYERYLVRMEEMRQSVRIVEQALSQLPEGDILAYDNKTVLPPKEEVYNTIEGLIHHFELTMPGFGISPESGAEIYSATEAPNGELGFYLVSDGSGKPYRLRVRPPSFLNYAPVGELLMGTMISDTVAVIGSLNVIAGELDR